MKVRTLLISGVAIATVCAGWTVAQAAPVAATLSATYFHVADGSDLDFNLFSKPNVLDGSGLGPNGLPVATAPYGVHDVTAVTHEITWWSPALNTKVTQTGTGTIALPYSSNMYAPNSTGADDGSFFETAIFKGTFDLATSGTVEFQLGSDDDSFIYVDGVLFGQNPGVHGVTNVDFTSPTLTVGSHSLEVFYADRENTGAYLSLNLLSTGVVVTPPAVPEPATWAMMLVGLGMIGFAARRRQNVSVSYA